MSEVFTNSLMARISRLVRKKTNSFLSLLLLFASTLLVSTSAIAQVGTSCATPQVLTTLPYTGTGFNTAGFNNVTSSPCNALYVGGDDYVFSYTATAAQGLAISLNNTATWVGITVTAGCANTATSCFAFAGSSAANPSLLTPPMVPGTTYFITISTYPSPQTTAFDISVQAVQGGLKTTAQAGNWSDPLTWVGGVLPIALDSIVLNHPVVVDVATAAGTSITINDSLRFNGAAVRSLVASGNIVVGPNGFINSVPTTGTSQLRIFVGGNLTVNGSANLAANNFLLVFNGSTPQTLGGAGTLLNGNTIREIESRDLNITMPVNVSARYTIISGVLNTNGNLSMDNTLGGVTTGGVTFRRGIVAPPLTGGLTIGASAIYNLDYAVFTGQVAVPCTTGAEIPASRSINGIRVAANAGNHVFVSGGSLTVTSGSNSTALTFPNTVTAPGALILSSGSLRFAAGEGLTFSNTALANTTTGFATAYVEGKMTWTVSATANQTRNFRIGDAASGTLVVLAGFNSGGQPSTYTVEMAPAPSGPGASGVSAVLGSRAFRVTSSTPLNATATIQLNWDGFSGLNIGNINQLRLVQAPAINGPWSPISAALGTGAITATGSRTSTAGVDLGNGEFFGFGTVSPGEVVVSSIISPNQSGCYSATEIVSAVLTNNGTTIDRSATSIVVRGEVITPAGTIVPLTPVTRSTGNFVATTSDTIVFANQVSFVDTGNYVVRVFIDSLAGQFIAGDTLARVVRSASWSAAATPGIIITTQSSTLSLARDGAPVQVISPTTPYVKLTEAIAFRTGTGAQLAYPAFIPASAGDFLELTNFSGVAANISGWQIDIFGSGARAYTFPANTVIAPGNVLVLHVGPGADDVANSYYNTGGANDAIFSTSTFGVTVKDASGALIDAVAFRGYVFPATAGVTPADWSGASATTSSAGLMLINFDNNTGGNWVVSTIANRSTLGSVNAGVSYVAAAVNWVGPGTFTATGNNISTGSRPTAGTETFTATIIQGGSCTRTAQASLQVVAPVIPVAGFTTSSATATTGGIVSTVTLTDTSLNIPFQRRWTITPTTFSFVNGTNDSSVAPQVQFAAVGNYAVKLWVSNPAGADSLTVSNAVAVTLAYCASNATNTGDTKIDSVILGTAFTGTASNVCQTYSNFADSLGVVAVITKTQPYPMMVRSGYCGTTAYAARGRVFIDFNKDGNFTANEAVADFGPLTATGSAAAREWFSMNLVVPVSADTGVARLRIVYREDATTFDAVTGCGTYGYGETEDYLVRITNPVVANPVLASPANNTFLNVNGPDQVQVNINWTPATRFTGTAAPATYIWQLASRTAGNFNAPLLSLASNNAGADTALTLSLGQLDQALASLSVAVGDTVRGIWRVRAISGTDTVFSAQTWNIDIRRGTVTEAITAFSLVTPPNNTILSVEGPGSQTAQIRWTTPVVTGTAPVTYQWLATTPGGNFNTPLVTLNANASDTALILSYTAIDALLASLNVNLGDSARLDWTVRVNSGSFTRLATQTWRITMVRGGIAALRFAAAPVSTGATTGLRAPNGTSAHTFFRAASFVPASELAAAGIQNGSTISALALRTTTGANAPARGKMSVYLSNGQNTTYTRGTAWTGAINGLNIHHDDSVTIQTGIGNMVIQFSQPFVYTGGSIELAYEWNGSAPFATVAAVYAANTAITSSLVSAASATAAPATMGATAFRPEFIWGVDDRKANEIEVITMFAKGRNPLNYGTPEVVQAIVRNNGYQTRTNVPVTLAVAGPNNFTQFNVQTITQLAVDATQLVTFAPINGSVVGFNNMTVSVPADGNNANNSKSWAQEQTDSIFSYNDSVTVGNGAVGYNTSSGLLLSRFSINGTRSVAAARIRIGDGAAIAGNSVSAVVLDESGVIVSQSAPVALTTADLRTWVVFPFTAPVNVTNGSFYIGLAQTANTTTGFFPVAFQAETPTRANAYFTAPLAGGVLPSPVSGFRLMIEAHVGPEFVPADTLSRFNLVAPSNNTTLNLQGDPTQTAQIRWRSSTRTGGVGTTTYQWLLDVPAGDFSNPVLRVNAGTDTSLTLTYGQIVDSLAAKGVQVGSGFAGRWTVVATNGPVSRLANIPFTITLNRGVMTSIEETDFSKSISLYPNPAAYSAKLQINSPGDKELSIVIVNAVGQEMKKFNVNSSIANDIELDLTSLNQGLYFVRVTDGNEMAIKRLMIQR